MESRLTCFGGGFVTITMGGVRMAYLRTIKDDIPLFSDDERDLTLEFYEFMNPDIWNHVGGVTGDLYGGLRLHARYGNIGVRKLIKSPSGGIRARVFDVKNARWEIDGEDRIDFQGQKSLPKRFNLYDVPSRLER